MDRILDFPNPYPLTPDPYANTRSASGRHMGGTR